MFSFHSESKDRLGEFYILISALFWGAFPIVIHYPAGKLPPLFYAAITNLLAAALVIVILLCQRKVKELFIKKVRWNLVMVAIFSIVIPYALIFYGTRNTSGINTSILLSVEVFFALIIGMVIGEKFTLAKASGAIAMVIGTALVMYNGTFAMNLGDIMILVATASFPIGNAYAKRALKYISPCAILFARTFLGGLILLALSMTFREISLNAEKPVRLIRDFLPLILMNGLIISGISKIAWYKGLKFLDIGKANIIAASAPAFSLVMAAIFLKESPTLYQLVGLAGILTGLYIITLRGKPIICPNAMP